MTAKSQPLTSLAPVDGPQRAPLAFDGLDDLLGFRARMAHVAMYRDFNVALTELGVSQRQTAILWLIGANPGASQAELGAALGMDSATMVGVIDRLENEGRVIRKLSQADRRRRELHLTPAGVKLLQQVKATVTRQDQRFKAQFSAPDLEILLDGLRRIADSGRS